MDVDLITVLVRHRLIPSELETGAIEVSNNTDLSN